MSNWTLRDMKTNELIDSYPSKEIAESAQMDFIQLGIGYRLCAPETENQRIVNNYTDSDFLTGRCSFQEWKSGRI